MTEKKEHKKAVAFGYDAKSDIAPKLLAKGKGYVAEQLIAEAQKHNIPIQEDKALVELLSQLEINETIPEELYAVVAEVFAFVYRIDKNMK